MKTYKVFLIQPKAELSDDKIHNDRKQALDLLQKFLGKDVKIETLNQLCDLYIGVSEDDGPLWFLGKDIQLIDKCDFVLVCKGFGCDKRSKMQMQVCVEYNIPRIFESNIEGLSTIDIKDFDNYLNQYEWREIKI